MQALSPLPATEEDSGPPSSESTRSTSADKPEPSPGSPGNVVTAPRIRWPSSLQWVPDNFFWAQVKPVIRCAIAAWISTVLFLIPPVEAMMGQAGFLIIIGDKLLVAFMSPPSDPFMAVLEREFMILLFVTATWAWSCLAIKFADMARVHRNPAASFADALTGQYIEAAPTVIIGVFLFIGTAVVLFIRSRNVFSQLFACILGCLCLDVSLTTAAGKSIVVPISLHSAVSLVMSVLIFPQTVSSQFTTRLGLVLEPLVKSFELHQAILTKDPYSADFSKMVTDISASVAKSEARLIPLAASVRLLASDLIFSRYAPLDFVQLHQTAKRMAVRAHGMIVYFRVVDPTREKFPITPIASRISTPAPASPAVSRPPSPPRTPTRETADLPHVDEEESPTTPTKRNRHSHHSHHSHHHHHHHHNLLIHSLHLSLGRKKAEHAVGVFESQRYLDLEANLVHPEVESHTKETTELLSKCYWLRYVRQGTTGRWITGQKERDALKARIGELEAVRATLNSVREQFRNEARHLILEPWRSSFNYDHENEHETPPHRHLFHCYVYQYHLLQMSANVLTMLDEIHKMEKQHRTEKLWTPAATWNVVNWHFSDFGQDEEDPDKVMGVPTEIEEGDLGMAKRRDPDALPPRNHLEWAMNRIYLAVAQLGSGNTLYAIKAATLTVLMCLPSLLRSSAHFAYENRFVWGIFMGQVTLARFRGTCDTVFGLSTRVLSTFLGGILGMVMWYISSGSGHGNAFGLGALCAVCFPFFFYGRLYWPGFPMKVIIFFVTAILVIGYSYQDGHIRALANPGFGWDVAWRRFIIVTSGVMAAGVFSLLPPSTTIRKYERTSLATNTTELGTLYCDIISFANSRRAETDPQTIVTALIAIRSRISRSMALKGNAVYEFSLKGRWPAKRYHKIMELQQQLAYSLSHLMSVVEHMEPAWTRAFLQRTRFLDTDFQGDVLAVISMISTALRTGCPLPQITPCPLLARFQTQYGLHVIHKDSEEDYGLPRQLTLDTLQNEQYLKFCVGVATAYNIISRLDRLMHQVKEIVGEQYHIHSAGLPLATRMTTRGGVALGSRTNSIQFRPPNEMV
ncbi:hypothetical protein MIND_01078900 [Mycena indigotica]|uniref:ER transporter 6TM N-terminal domain-containing protein n=1 Tax=Mycena indigotica TaxID=2126181 RepID=A0A8H6S9N3_9AGAR|nr:uncharacterized protein MIND_01078900 [Mycena indigotica]KAF7295393.1 hypothetical protein MIND_01078900 [Mycena indigotica]